jgi:hypothetical protein
MTLSYSDIIITLIIVGVVLFAAHRMGQANPVGTGRLSKRLSAVEVKVAEQGEKLDSLDKAMLTLADSTAETARELGAMRMEMAGDRGLAERTWASVDRLQNYFIENSFKRLGGGQ